MRKGSQVPLRFHSKVWDKGSSYYTYRISLLVNSHIPSGMYAPPASRMPQARHNDGGMRAGSALPLVHHIPSAVAYSERRSCYPLSSPPEE